MESFSISLENGIFMGTTSAFLPFTTNSTRCSTLCTNETASSLLTPVCSLYFDFLLPILLLFIGNLKSPTFYNFHFLSFFHVFLDNVMLFILFF